MESQLMRCRWVVIFFHFNIRIDEFFLLLHYFVSLYFLSLFSLLSRVWRFCTTSCRHRHFLSWSLCHTQNLRTRWSIVCWWHCLRHHHLRHNSSTMTTSTSSATKSDRSALSDLIVLELDRLLYEIRRLCRRGNFAPKLHCVLDNLPSRLLFLLHNADHCSLFRQDLVLNWVSHILSTWLLLQHIVRSNLEQWHFGHLKRRARKLEIYGLICKWVQICVEFDFNILKLLKRHYFVSGYLLVSEHLIELLSLSRPLEGAASQWWLISSLQCLDDLARQVSWLVLSKRKWASALERSLLYENAIAAFPNSESVYTSFLIVDEGKLNDFVTVTYLTIR